MSSELKYFAPILISIFTATATTLLIGFIKDKKKRIVEKITDYDERVGIIDSIAINSCLSFILALTIALYNVAFLYKVPFIILLAITVIFFTYVHLRFRKSLLIKAYYNQEKRCEFILISLFVIITWISALTAILFIKHIGDGATITAFTLILLLFATLFNLRQYLMWNLTRMYKKIVVVTIDGDIYESTNLINLENFIALYESKSDKRVIIPNNQIKTIEYEYQKSTLADFIDKEC